MHSSHPKFYEKVLNCYECFKKKLDEIDSYITNCKNISIILAYVPQLKDTRISELCCNTRINNKFEYNTIIIGIYSAFENLIYDLLNTYLDGICSRSTSINCHSVLIQENYIHQISDFIKKPTKFSRVNDHDTIKVERLISDFFKGKINTNIYITHGGNTNSKRLLEIFRNIDIFDLDVRLKKNHHIKDLVSADNDQKIGDILKSNPNANIIFSLLDNIVDQRNSIAHTGESDARLSKDTIQSNYLPYMKAMGIALYEVLLLEFYNLDSIKLVEITSHNPVRSKKSDILYIQKDDLQHLKNKRLFSTKGNQKKIIEILEIKQHVGPLATIRLSKQFIPETTSFYSFTEIE